MARTVPGQTTLVLAGDVVQNEYWNENVKTLNDFLGNRPAFRGTSTTGSSISNNVWTPIPYNNNSIDTDSGHSQTVNNTRYTSQVGGYYWIKGIVAFTSAVAQLVRVDTAVAINGTILPGSVLFQDRLTSQLGSFQASALYPLNVGDYAEIWVRQTNPGTNALTLDNGSTAEPDFNVVWIAS